MSAPPSARVASSFMSAISRGISAPKCHCVTSPYRLPALASEVVRAEISNHGWPASRLMKGCPTVPDAPRTATLRFLTPQVWRIGITPRTYCYLSTMQIGIDSFALAHDDASLGLTPADHMRNLIDQMAYADEVGLDVFGIGEHHRKEFLDSAPSVILAAAAGRTKKIRLTSAVAVLSAVDPVRLFQQFATLDLVSQGRAEMVVGRGSFIDAYPLFGLDTNDYDELFAEKLELLLQLRDEEHPHWSGTHRPALTGQGVYPRPMQEKLPIWVGVGGTPASFVRAGLLGLPLMVAIIGGETHRFRPLVDLYREAGRRAGYTPEQLTVGMP